MNAYIPEIDNTIILKRDLVASLENFQDCTTGDKIYNIKITREGFDHRGVQFIEGEFLTISSHSPMLYRYTGKTLEVKCAVNKYVCNLIAGGVLSSMYVTGFSRYN